MNGKLGGCGGEERTYHLELIAHLKHYNSVQFPKNFMAKHFTSESVLLAVPVITVPVWGAI